jgi:ABC-2 type transport system ATP-binding protein
VSHSPPLVRTHGLTKAFDRVEAVRSLDLVVPANSIFGFLGPNGAGKTTTMKMLLGLIRPTGGGGEVFGLDIVRDSDDIRRRVGYLPQDPRFYDHMTARETLRFTARFFYTGPAAAIERRIDEMLEMVGLTDRADRPIKGFSGGERQRLGIAQAQVNRPDLLILDEPAASLDPLGRRDVLAVLERLRESATVIYSTHILDDVQRVSDTVAILNRGQLLAQGPIGALLAGSGGIAFTVRVRGDAARAERALRAEPWVTDVESSNGSADATLTIGVTDPAEAEARLLRVLLADEELVVTDYRRRAADLEEVFIEMVQGEAK